MDPKPKYRIPLFNRTFDPGDIAAVKSVLESGWVTEGDWAEMVGDELRKITKARHVVLFPSGAVALWAAYRTWAMTDNMPSETVLPEHTSYVTIPDHTFAATLTAAMMVFKRVDIVDSDMHAMNTPIHVGLIVPVHLYGGLMDMDHGHSRARIDDACQALGVYDGEGVHAGMTAKAACLSFYADKLCTSGEGGAVITNDPDFADRLRVFKNVGRHKRGGYLHPYHGLTLRMTDMQCALLWGQLRRIEAIRANRIAVEKAYMKNVDLITSKFDDRIKRMPNRYIVRTRDPESLIRNLSVMGIEARTTFVPLHRQPFVQAAKEQIQLKHAYPLSWGAHQGTVYLPFGMNLTTEQAEEVGYHVRRYEDGIV